MRPKLEAYRANVEKQARLRYERQRREYDRQAAEWMRAQEVAERKRKAEHAVARAKFVAQGHESKTADLMALYSRLGAS